MASKVDFRGDELKRKYRRSCEVGINKVMADCVGHSKANHPGWKNRTGLAEGSIKIQRFASELGGAITGLWGSAQVHYMIWLELKHGSALRRSADVNYKNLHKYIKQAAG